MPVPCHTSHPSLIFVGKARGQCYKTFFLRNLTKVQKSSSVCPRQGFPA
jgi:hypothetical protein